MNTATALKKVKQRKAQEKEQTTLDAILKLLESIDKKLDGLKYKGLGYPFTPPFGTPHDSTPYVPNNVSCYSCKKDTGIPFVLNMVIPPEGLKCPHCGAVAVKGNTVTCQDYPTHVNINTSSFDSTNIKATINKTTISDAPVVPSMWRYKVAGQI